MRKSVFQKIYLVPHSWSSFSGLLLRKMLFHLVDNNFSLQDYCYTVLVGKIFTFFFLIIFYPSKNFSSVSSCWVTNHVVFGWINRGDYRTGKRLNMRKVIPYIASQFRKDKIWLRRTKPSKRQYQICLAIDDSSSMVDNHTKQVKKRSVVAGWWEKNTKPWARDHQKIVWQKKQLLLLWNTN